MPSPGRPGCGRSRWCYESLKGYHKAYRISSHREAHKVKRLEDVWHDERGVTTVEYALLLAVLVVGAAAIWTALRTGIQSGVNAASDELAGA